MDITIPTAVFARVKNITAPVLPSINDEDDDDYYDVDDDNDVVAAAADDGDND